MTLLEHPRSNPPIEGLASSLPKWQGATILGGVVYPHVFGFFVCLSIEFIASSTWIGSRPSSVGQVQLIISGFIYFLN